MIVHPFMQIRFTVKSLFTYIIHLESNHQIMSICIPTKMDNHICKKIHLIGFYVSSPGTRWFAAYQWHTDTTRLWHCLAPFVSGEQQISHVSILDLTAISMRLCSYASIMMASSNENIFASLALCEGNPSAVPWLPVGLFHKGQRRRALMFSLIYARTNGSVNNRDAGDLIHHPAHYGVAAIWCVISGYFKTFPTSGIIILCHFYFAPSPVFWLNSIKIYVV